MNNFQLIYPMCAMVLLTFSVLIRLFRTRSKLAKEGDIDPSFFSIYQGAPEPEASAKLTRHFTNLYEAPVLFYVCCLAALVTNLTGLPFLVLAWAYVLARMVHTTIHTGSNKIWPRVYAYFTSWIILLLLWILLVYRVMTFTAL